MSSSLPAVLEVHILILKEELKVSKQDRTTLNARGCF